MGRLAGMRLQLSLGSLTPVLGVLLLGLLAGLAAAGLVAHPQAGLAIVLPIATLLPVIVRLVQRKFDPFEPIQILAITFFVLYALRPAGELLYGMKYFNNSYMRGGFTGASVVSLVGVLSVYLGYAAATGGRLARRIPTLPHTWDPVRSVRFGIWVLVVCGLFTAAFAASVGPSTLFNFYLGRTTTDYQTFLSVVGYVGLGPELTIPAAIIFAFAWWRLRTFKVFLLFMISFAGAVFVNFPQGNRTYIIAFIFPLLVLPYLIKGRRPSGVGVAVALIGAVLAMNILLAIRNVETRKPLLSTVTGAVTHVGTQLKQFTTGVDLAEYSVLELEWEAYHSKANPLSFHPGQTILSSIVYPLPRKIVGKKPKAAGQWVVDRLFPSKGGKRASFNPAMFGDFYSDYGFVTIVLFCAAVGIATRVLWEYFRRNSASLGMQIVFAATLPVLVIVIRNSVLDAVARGLYLTGPLVLCMIVCARPRMRRFAGYRVRPELKDGAGPELNGTSSTTPATLP
jgi:oligosaccharide repeat unit polymerase